MTDKNMDAAIQLNAEAQELLANSEFQAALGKFSEALDSLPEDENEVSGKVLSNMGHANVKIENFDAAKEAFSEAAKFFRQAGDQVSLGQQLGNIGSSHRDLEEFNEALESYFEALDIFSKLGDKGGIAWQKSNIAYAYSKKGVPEEALDYFTKAKVLFDELGDEQRSVMCGENIDLLAEHLEGRA